MCKSNATLPSISDLSTSSHWQSGTLAPTGTRLTSVRRFRDWRSHDSKQRDAQPRDYAASTAGESSVCGGRRTEARAIGVRSDSSCICAARRAVEMAIPCPGSAAAAASAEKNCKQQQHALAPARGCRVAGCRLELAPGYSAKYRICPVHYKMSSLEVDGKEQRFCQQCGRFHEVEAFEGERRSCKESLARHKQRRKKAEALRARRQEQDQQGTATGGAHESEAPPPEAEAEQRQEQSKVLGRKREAGQPAGHKSGSSASKAAPPPSQMTEVSATSAPLRKQPRHGSSLKKRSAQQAGGSTTVQKKARSASPTAEEQAVAALTAFGASSGGSSRAASEDPSVHPPAPAQSVPSKPPTPAHSSPCTTKSPLRRGHGSRGSPLLRTDPEAPPGMTLPAPQLAVPGPTSAAPRPQPHLVQEALETIGGGTLPGLEDVPSTEELLTFSQELGLLLDAPLPAPACAAGTVHALPTAWPLPACAAAPATAWPAPAHSASAAAWGSAPAAHVAPAQGHLTGTSLQSVQFPAWQSALTSSLAPLQHWSVAGTGAVPASAPTPSAAAAAAAPKPPAPAAAAPSEAAAAASCQPASAADLALWLRQGAAAAPQLALLRAPIALPPASGTLQQFSSSNY